MSKSKSIKRANDTTTSLADILISEGAKSLVPGASLAYELSKLMFKHAYQFHQDTVESRLEMFHNALLNDQIGENTSLNEDEFLNKQFDIEDYYLLLDSCVRDMEGEKAKIYANLMRSLVDRKINPSKRRDLIQTLREITFSEVNIIRKVYIHKRFRIMSPQLGPDLRSREAGGRASDGRLINRLKYNGLITESDEQLTDFANELIQLVFPESDLAPEAIGATEASGLKLLILCYRLDDQHSLEVINALQQILDGMRIESSPIAIGKANANVAAMMNAAGILLVDDSDTFQKHVDWKAVEIFAEKRPLYRLNITRNDVPMDNVPIAEEYSLNGKDKMQIRTELSRYVELVLNSTFINE